MPTSYEFAYSERALKFLETISLPKLRRQISQKLAALATDPKPPKCKLLHGVLDGDNPVYRVRSGDYRILYSVRIAVIVILDIDHRKDVYR